MTDAGLIAKKPWCGLESEWKSCCCNCRYHVQDNHHCTTTGRVGGKCVCSERRGWACIVNLNVPELGRDCIHSGWGEHGMCELHQPKEKA